MDVGSLPRRNGVGGARESATAPPAIAPAPPLTPEPRLREPQRAGGEAARSRGRAFLGELLGASGFPGLCCVIAVALSVWLARDIWQDGIPLGTDMGAHFVRADVAWDQFFTGGRLDGWQARFGLGYQQSLFLGPGFNILVGLLRAASFGLLSTFTAVKLAIVLSYAAMPVAVAVLARSFGLGRRSIGLAALLSLGVSVSVGGAGLAGITTWALVPNQLGAVFTVLGAAGVVSIVRSPSPAGVLATAVCLALVIITHPWASIVLALFGLCFGAGLALEWVLTRRSSSRRRLPRVRAVLQASPDDGRPLVAHPVRCDAHVRPLRRAGALALAGALGAGLAAVQVVPLVAHRDLMGGSATFADEPILVRLASALRGEDLLRPYVMILVIAGLVWTLVVAAAGRPFALALAVTPFAYIAVAHTAGLLGPDIELTQQLMNRSLFFVAIVGVLLAATLLGEIGPAVGTARRLLRSTGPEPVRRPRLHPLSALALVAVTTAVILVPQPPWGEHTGTVTPLPALTHAADALRRLVPDTGRYAVQASELELDRAGIWNTVYWLAWTTGRNSLANFNLQSSIVGMPVYAGDDLGRRAPAADVDRLRRYGVTHVLLFEPELLRDLVTHHRVRTVWSEGPLTIIELLDTDRRPSPVPVVTERAEPTGGRVVSADPEHPVFEISGTRARRVTLAIAWSPKWRATVDGEAVELGRNAENLMTVAVPAGTTTLALDYEQDSADRVGLAVTGATALVMGLAVLGRRRIARRWPPAERRPALVAAPPPAPGVPARPTRSVR